MSARAWKRRRAKRFSMLRWLRDHKLPDNLFCDLRMLVWPGWGVTGTASAPPLSTPVDADTL